MTTPRQPLPHPCGTPVKDKDRVGTPILQIRLREFEGLCTPALRSHIPPEAPVGSPSDPEGSSSQRTGGQSEAVRGYGPWECWWFQSAEHCTRSLTALQPGLLDFTGHPCNIWDILALKSDSLFSCDSNLTGCPMFYLQPYPEQQGRGKEALWQVPISLESPFWAVGFSSFPSPNRPYPPDLV